MTTTLYDILGLPPDASPDDIKAAHRAKAKQHHPDAGGDAERFGEIQRAYDVLSDPEKRDRYDATGSTDARNPADVIESEARDFFAQILIAAVDDPWAGRIDIIARGKQKVEGERASINQQIKDAKARIVKAEKMAARFKAKPGKPDLAAGIYATVKRDLQQAVANGERRLAVMARLEELLDGYEFEVDKPQQQTAGVFFGGASTTTGWS